MRSLVLVGVAACGGGAAVSATATVEPGAVVVELACRHTVVVTGYGQEVTCDAKQPVRLRVQAAAIGAGKQTLHLAISSNEEKSVLDVAVDVPDSAITATLEVVGCAPGADVRIALQGDRKLQCAVDKSMVKLRLQTNPNAKVTVGAVSLKAPASGQVELLAAVGDALLELTFDEIHAGSTGSGRLPGPFELKVPWKVEAAGKTGSGELALQPKDLALLAGAWLTSETNALASPKWLGATHRAAALVLPGYGLMGSPRTAKLRDTGVVALVEEFPASVIGECAYKAEHASADEPPHMIAQMGIPARLTIVDLTTRQQTVRDVKPSPECQVIASSNATEVKAHPDYLKIAAELSGAK